MKKIGKKLYICLFDPRKIGFFLGEKIWKVVFQLILCTLIAVAPLALSLSLHKEISSVSRNEIKNTLVVIMHDSDLKLENGILTGTRGRYFYLEEFSLIINPDNSNMIEYGNLDSYILEFGKTGINVYLMGRMIHTQKYAELGAENIDFIKIANDVDYVELDKFIKLVDTAFLTFHSSWVGIGYFTKVIEILARVLINALIISLLSKMFNPFLRQRYRFKASLDAQFIFLVFVLFDILFNANFMYIIGMFFSMTYLFRALRSIVPIPVKKINPDNKKDGE